MPQKQAKQGVCTAVVQAATAVVLLAVLCAALCRGDTGYLPAGAEIWAIALYLGVLCLTARACRRWQAALARVFPLAVGVAALVLCAAQLALASRLRYTPNFDLAAIYQGGIAWAEGRGLVNATDPTVDAATYYYYFPNNLGGTALLALVFWVYRLLGGADYFWCATVLNALLCTATFVVVCWAGR